jgi:hypothetical protein
LVPLSVNQPLQSFLVHARDDDHPKYVFDPRRSGVDPSDQSIADRGEVTLHRPHRASFNWALSTHRRHTFFTIWGPSKSSSLTTSQPIQTHRHYLHYFAYFPFLECLHATNIVARTAFSTSTRSWTRPPKTVST